MAFGIAARIAGAAALILVAPCLASSGAAQERAHVLPPHPPRLHAGTPVQLRTLDRIDPRGLGDRTVALTVAQDLRAADRIVIPMGTPALGQLRRVRGGTELRLLQVAIGRRRIALDGRASWTRKAGAPFQASVKPLVIGSRPVPAGTRITGYLARDLIVPMSGTSIH